MPSAQLEILPPLKTFLTETASEVEAREAGALTNLLRARHNRCVIFGAGTLGQKAVALLRETGVEPLAIADNNEARWGTTLAGLPVLSAAEAATRYGDSAVFFVTIWNVFHTFRATLAQLTSLGCTSVSSYSPLFWRFGDRFMELRLLNEPAHRLYNDLDQVFELETLWADQESLATYRAEILYRALGDSSHLPVPPFVETYFPPDILKLVHDEVLVDCGAFDGDTVRLVLSLAGNDFKAIYSIEADRVSAGRMQEYLATLPAAVRGKIHELDCAVGLERCTLHFSMSGDLTSKMQTDGASVQCIPLDELFADKPITFLKMDIEGAEFDALRGGESIIRRDAPILAICTYHTQADIYRIPLLMRSFNPEYKFFLRTYDGDGFQSVVYAIPPHRMLT